MRADLKQSATDLEYSTALKELLKEFSAAGVTYEEICDTVGDPNEWNSNSLKQFIYRKGRARKTRKLLSLACVVAKLPDLDHRLKYFQNDPRIKILRGLGEGSPIESSSTTSEHQFSEIWKSFNTKSLGIFLPETLAFVRYARDQRGENYGQKLPKIIITVLVTTRRTTEGYKFTMKILGRSKRIVVGEVYQTVTNTYFIGVAHPVNQIMSEEDFFDLDAFDLENVHRKGSHNELGIETFCLSNSELSYSIIPVCFTGMDGMGRPYSGIGLIIDTCEFSNYGINEHVFSSAECTGRNKKLTSLLEEANACTVQAPGVGAYTLQEKIPKILEG